MSAALDLRDDQRCCLTCAGAAEWLRVNQSFQRMIVCKTCGNKRCPKATDHRLECTGSNRPGQKGSIYQ